MIIVAQGEGFLRGIRNVVGNGYSGNLRIALIPDWFREKILKELEIAQTYQQSYGVMLYGWILFMMVSFC